MLLHISQREIISKEKTLSSEVGLPTSAAGLVSQASCLEHLEGYKVTELFVLVFS